MNDDTTTHDSTEQRATDDSTANRRQFLQGAAASIAGAAGLKMASEGADAAPSKKQIVVVGRGRGHHTFQIQMQSGGSISRGPFGDGNDAVTTNGSGDDRVEGDLWQWNVDSFEYTGEIDSIVCKGNVGVHIPNGAFGSEANVDIEGVSDGYHSYEIGSTSADIEPVSGTTEWDDWDRGGSGTEKQNTPDNVTGSLVDQGSDCYELRHGNELQYVGVDGGHVRIDPFTPGGSGGGNSFDKGEASLVMFYMGDSRFTTFFQETTALHPALDGYDEKVLLKHDIGIESIASTGAQNEADVVKDPTRSNFVSELNRLRNQGYTVDLYIFSHGYDHGAFRLSDGSHGTVDLFDTNDVRNLKNTVGDPVPLRMVYQVSCWGSEMNSAWRDAGAKAAAGSRYVNFYPTHFSAFASNWTSGQNLRTAIDNSSTPTSRGVVRNALAWFDAPATNGDEWGSASGGCPFGQTILGNNACARDYYINRWGHDASEWRTWSNQKNGKANMNHASEKLIDGDATITNGSYY